MQLFVPSRTGQDTPPFSGWVTTVLPFRLCPGRPPQLQDFEQELQALQALTWTVFRCVREVISGIFHVLPGSQLDRGSHCNFFHHRELGKVFHCGRVESPQPSLSDFALSCTSLNRSSTSSKASPECVIKTQSCYFIVSNLPYSQLGRGSCYNLLCYQELGTTLLHVRVELR